LYYVLVIINILNLYFEWLAIINILKM
jgi:hypothetical protein